MEMKSKSNYAKMCGRSNRRTKGVPDDIDSDGSDQGEL